MRVVLVTSIPHGGPVEHALLLGRELARAGIDVRAAVANDGLAERFAGQGVRAAALPLGPGVDLTGARRLRRFARGADLVHSHDRRSGLWVRAAPRPGRATALVHSLHGLPEPYLQPPVGAARPGVRAVIAYRGLERALAARADALVAPSQAAAALLHRRLGYPLGAIEVVPNGVDVPEELVGRRPLDVVGTLSAMEPVKGLTVFLRAAARVAERRPATRFVLFGEGSLAGELRALARELGLDVEFPGFVPAPEALARIGVLALPSFYETSGIALLQAMAAGVPAVASRVGGIPEVAGDDAVALVEPGDPGALADAIVQVLDDPELAARRARAARAAAAPLTAARTAQAMLAVYERALARRR